MLEKSIIKINRNIKYISENLNLKQQIDELDILYRDDFLFKNPHFTFKYLSLSPDKQRHGETEYIINRLGLTRHEKYDTIFDGYPCEMKTSTSLKQSNSMKIQQLRLYQEEINRFLISFINLYDLKLSHFWLLNREQMILANQLYGGNGHSSENKLKSITIPIDENNEIFNYFRPFLNEEIKRKVIL